MEVKNGRIVSTMLGYEDHGIFTYMLTLDFGGSGQGFGGYSLGGEYTDKVVQGLLKALQVESWEALKGQYVRVEYDERTMSGRIKRIGHLLQDSWFDPKQVSMANDTG